MGGTRLQRATDKHSLNYGGRRWWFIWWKRGVACRRRCRILYTPFGQTVFACRKCHELTYESCQKSGSYFYENFSRPSDVHNKALERFKRARSIKKKEKLYRKLLWADDMMCGYIDKVIGRKWKR